MRTNARTVGQARRTSSGPPITVVSQVLAGSYSCPNELWRTATGWRQSESLVLESLNLIQQLADVVQAQARLETHWLSRDLEGFYRFGLLSCVQANAKILVHDLFERP